MTIAIGEKFGGKLMYIYNQDRDIDLYTLKYIYISGAKLRLNYFPTTPPPPLLPPLEIAQRHKFVNRKSCIHKLAP